MRAVKGNREYTITADAVAASAKRGFDVYDDRGKLVERAQGKAVPWVQYEALLKENSKLKAELDKLKAKE